MRQVVITRALSYVYLQTLIGNLFIADTYNNRIRKVTVSTEIITTIAGTGNAGYSGDGRPSTSAALYSPIGVTLDSVGTT